MLLAQFCEPGIRAAAQDQINTTGGIWHLGDAEVIVPAPVMTGELWECFRTMQVLFLGCHKATVSVETQKAEEQCLSHTNLK